MHKIKKQKSKCWLKVWKFLEMSWDLWMFKKMHIKIQNTLLERYLWSCFSHFVLQQQREFPQVHCFLVDAVPQWHSGQHCWEGANELSLDHQFWGVWASIARPGSAQNTYQGHTWRERSLSSAGPQGRWLQLWVGLCYITELIWDFSMEANVSAAQVMDGVSNLRSYVRKTQRWDQPQRK